MSHQTRVHPERSQRDELERLQEELRAVRQQREALPREKAELAAQVTRLEEEVRELRRMRDAARDEWNRPLPSLPEQFVPPFRAMSSRRTAYGRGRFALRALSPLLGTVFFVYMVAWQPWNLAKVGAAVLLSFVLLYLLQGHEADDEALAWSFDDEGFRQDGPGAAGKKILYSEVREVTVKRGWLQRLYGFGTVRVTWVREEPGGPSSPSGGKRRVAAIKLLDDPQRLAEWLKEQARRAREDKEQGAHGP